MAQRVQVATETGATHSFAEEEKQSFVEHINNALRGDVHLNNKLPIDPNGMELFSKCADGLILWCVSLSLILFYQFLFLIKQQINSKLINDAVPDTIDGRVVNLAPKNNFEIAENNNLCINSAKAIGCSVVNIGSQDLIEGRPHLILGLIWQIVRVRIQKR
jgi:plastin-1